MKRLTLTLVALLLAVSVSAGTVEISIPTTAKQDALLAAMLADINADREVPFANFNAYARWVLVNAVKSWIETRQELEASDLIEAVPENFGDTATPAHCNAAGLSPGCKKGEVACFVLTGSATCVP